MHSLHSEKNNNMDNAESPVHANTERSSQDKKERHYNIVIRNEDLLINLINL